MNFAGMRAATDRDRATVFAVPIHISRIVALNTARRRRELRRARADVANRNGAVVAAHLDGARDATSRDAGATDDGARAGERIDRARAIRDARSGARGRRASREDDARGRRGTC
jgi:hypothetical protein